MERKETAFFTGHRDFYRAEGSEAYNVLLSAIRSHIKMGYKNFIAGGAVGFDTMAAECVLRLKAAGESARLVLFLPCKNQNAAWSYWETRKYKEIIKSADEVIYITQEYSRECMLMRDRAMADASSACIAYCNKQSGGTAYTVRYALSKGIAITNLANLI